jgi:hypothetical protein
MRAALTGSNVAQWCIHGPLEIPEFYLPLVARTGHPALTIRWATALQFLHFDLEDASLELLRLIRDWHASPRSEPPALAEQAPDPPFPDLRMMLGTLARRPGMFLGSNEGWSLRCYLHGMAAGGDWLGLPELFDLRYIVDLIEGRSFESYGSRFAAYRVYSATPLLAWAGIEPE